MAPIPSLQNTDIRWQEVERRLALLERAMASTVRYGATPLPNDLNGLTIRASKLLPPAGPGGQAFMQLDLTGNVAGSFPLQRVNDGVNATDRVQVGNLAANGTSSAQYGIRVNDATGTPIFDSLGLINVMTQPTASVHPRTFFSTASTTYVSITGMSLTFSLPRSTSVLFIADSSSNVIGAAPGNWGTIAPYVDGAPQSNAGSYVALSLGNQVTNFSIYYQGTLAAGSHTIELRAAVDNASVTYQFFNGDAWIFKLGG